MERKQKEGEVAHKEGRTGSTCGCLERTLRIFSEFNNPKS